MPKFQRLTWGDLDKLTRNQLLPRLEAEQEYWARKQQRGMSPEDDAARAEFGRMLLAAIDPAGLAQEMGDTAAWLRGEGSAPTWFNEKPGRGPRRTEETR